MREYIKKNVLKSIKIQTLSINKKPEKKNSYSENFTIKVSMCSYDRNTTMEYSMSKLYTCH